MTKMVMRNLKVLVTLTMMVGCGQPQKFTLAPASEGFGQHITYNNQVDILWVVDNSFTMTQYQDTLSSQFGYFIDGLVQTKLDFNIGIISTDAGDSATKGKLLGNPKVITGNTANFKQVFSNNVRLGNGGSPQERGLQNMSMALSSTNLGGPNSGFLRKDALLVVVFLSDEDDKSSNNSTDYIGFLDQLKPAFANGSRGWIAHFIGSLTTNSPCNVYNANSEPGLRYMDLVSISSGANESICSSDLSVALTNVKKRIVEIITEYHLDREPDVSTIKVFINGVLVPQDAINGWTYQSGKRTIQFHGAAIPPADAFVSIDYQPLTRK